jgi:hypothetical protein
LFYQEKNIFYPLNALVLQAAWDVLYKLDANLHGLDLTGVSTTNLGNAFQLAIGRYLHSYEISASVPMHDGLLKDSPLHKLVIPKCEHIDAIPNNWQAVKNLYNAPVLYIPTNPIFHGWDFIVHNPTGDTHEIIFIQTSLLPLRKHEEDNQPMANSLITKGNNIAEWISTITGIENCSLKVEKRKSKKKMRYLFHLESNGAISAKFVYITGSGGYPSRDGGILFPSVYVVPLKALPRLKMPKEQKKT